MNAALALIVTRLLPSQKATPLHHIHFIWINWRKWCTDSRVLVSPWGRRVWAQGCALLSPTAPTLRCQCESDANRACEACRLPYVAGNRETWEGWKWDWASFPCPATDHFHANSRGTNQGQVSLMRWDGPDCGLQPWCHLNRILTVACKSQRQLQQTCSNQGRHSRKTLVLIWNKLQDFIQHSPVCGANPCHPE